MMRKIICFIFICSTLFSCSNKSTNNTPSKVTVKNSSAIAKPFEYDYVENENLDSTDYDYYIKYINNDLIGEKQYSIDSNLNESTKIYLGQIYCADVGFTYDVITRFDRIQMADGPRGNSRIIFIRSDKRTCRVYEKNMPYDLPVLIQKNEFIFYIDNDTIKENMNEGLLPIS